LTVFVKVFTRNDFESRFSGKFRGVFRTGFSDGLRYPFLPRMEWFRLTEFQGYRVTMHSFIWLPGMISTANELKISVIMGLFYFGR
jgi:hypothetical protein